MSYQIWVRVFLACFVSTGCISSVLKQRIGWHRIYFYRAVQRAVIDGSKGACVVHLEVGLKEDTDACKNTRVETSYTKNRTTGLTCFTLPCCHTVGLVSLLIAFPFTLGLIGDGGCDTRVFDVWFVIGCLVGSKNQIEKILNIWIKRILNIW